MLLFYILQSIVIKLSHFPNVCYQHHSGPLTQVMLMALLPKCLYICHVGITGCRKSKIMVYVHSILVLQLFGFSWKSVFRVKG